MLLPGSRFDLPFTCVDSAGAVLAPTGTPTAVLVQNGLDLGTTVTVTMTGAQGIAVCTIPSSGVNAGDRFYIRVSAVISGVTYVIPGSPESIADLAAIAAQVRTNLTTELGRVDVAVSSRLATAGYTAPTTPPTAAAIASQVRTELTTELGRVDVAVSSRLATAGYTAPTTPPTAAAIASQVRTELGTELGRVDATISSRLSTAGYTAPPSIAGLCTTVKANELLDAIEALPSVEAVAAGILADPENLLLTDADGYVTSTNGGGLVMPLMTEAGNRVSALPLQLFTGEGMPITLTVKDRDGNAIDLSGLDLVFCMARPPASVRTLAELRSFELAVLSADDWEEVGEVADLTGNDQGLVTFPAPEFATQQAGPLSFSLRVNDTGEVKARGALMVQYAA